MKEKRKEIGEFVEECLREYGDEFFRSFEEAESFVLEKLKKENKKRRREDEFLLPPKEVSNYLRNLLFLKGGRNGKF